MKQIPKWLRPLDMWMEVEWKDSTVVIGISAVVLFLVFCLTFGNFLVK